MYESCGIAMAWRGGAVGLSDLSEEEFSGNSIDTGRRSTPPAHGSVAPAALCPVCPQHAETLGTAHIEPNRREREEEGGGKLDLLIHN